MRTKFSTTCLHLQLSLSLFIWGGGGLCVFSSSLWPRQTHACDFQFKNDTRFRYSLGFASKFEITWKCEKTRKIHDASQWLTTTSQFQWLTWKRRLFTLAIFILCTRAELGCKKRKTKFSFEIMIPSKRIENGVEILVIAILNVQIGLSSNSFCFVLCWKFSCKHCALCAFFMQSYGLNLQRK